MLYPTTAHTDLANIRQNLEGVRDRVGSDRLVLVAVKANAYGHGAVVVSRMIQATKAADWLGVATVGEGLELREAGISVPILKFAPARGPAEVEAALVAGLTLPVVDQASVAEVEQAAARLRRPVPVHLKIDTGMRRVGVEPAAAPALAEQVAASRMLTLEGIFSHLPIADNPQGDEFTQEQISLFLSTAHAVEKAVGPVPIKHLANSGGVLGHPRSWLDMVRPGVMAYGSYPDPDSPRTVDLAPGLRWTTRVSFVKPVAAGETVGYGRTWTAPRDCWIATLPVGYGDGFSRLLSNRGRVLIDGRSHPIAGRVCMDQTMIDLGPEPVAAVGDEVVLIGRSGDLEITVAELAGLMGTITYEVTCLITGRVTRTH